MLRFTLFGIPVGVHASFLLVVVFGPLTDAASAMLWLVAVFLAVLLHELGHALTARTFGAGGVHLVLYGLGGLTSFQPGRIGHGRRFLISAAGSFFGIVMGAGIIGLARVGVFDGWNDLAIDFLDYFVFAAFIWGVLNWIPIVPLDGGHMVLHLAAMVNEEKAPLIAQIVTWLAVAIVVPLAIWQQYYFAAALVGIFAFMGLRDYRAQREPADEAMPEQPDPRPQRDFDPPEFPI